MATDTVGVQRRYAPSSICFGCGPANTDGLRIDSHPHPDGGLVLDFETREVHQAFPGMVNGGIIGTLMDCHANWTAAIALMEQTGDDEPPCTVTASFTVNLRRPTPLGPVQVRATVEDLGEDRATVRMWLKAGGMVCATGEGLFVAVKEGHPAHHRWS